MPDHDPLPDLGDRDLSRLLEWVRHAKRALVESGVELAADRLLPAALVRCDGHALDELAVLHGLPCPVPGCLEGTRDETVEARHQPPRRILQQTEADDLGGPVTVSCGVPSLRLYFRRRRDGEAWRWVQVRDDR